MFERSNDPRYASPTDLIRLQDAAKAHADRQWRETVAAMLEDPFIVRAMSNPGPRGNWKAFPPHGGKAQARRPAPSSRGSRGTRQPRVVDPSAAGRRRRANYRAQIY